MNIRLLIWGLIGLGISIGSCFGQTHSVARKWNEVLIQGIRNDFARPTANARSLFHISAAMYDAWAVFEPGVSPFFLGQKVGDFEIPFNGFPYQLDQRSSLRNETISYAAYTLMLHRYQYSPGFVKTKHLMDSLMIALGYQVGYTSSDYSTGSAASLGVYIGEQINLFGLQDGSNEAGGYVDLYYSPVNCPLNLTLSVPNFLEYANRWQPLQFGSSFVDQNGNAIQSGVTPFLGAEWGNVVPFALDKSSKTDFIRDGHNYTVYHDPGPPALIDTISGNSFNDPYKWGFTMVSAWSAQLDRSDGVMLDISPASIGNLDINQFPNSPTDYPKFYNFMMGGDISKGYSINPKTNQPYVPQLVPRGDYNRVLAQFWADGPSSETPPGHWFTILNYVADQPQLVKKFGGVGKLMDPLEWDVKSYLTLGGAVHDAAISIWSAKGYYDYVRPISAIRYMATRGQSSDPNLPRYSKAGIPLIKGLVELIQEGDSLAGPSNENINEIKIYAWRGFSVVKNPINVEAGVGWIMARDWWPYQKPTFVTPPFAGYTSGHSGFSRAAAQVLTLITGDEYFPGGLGEFVAKKDQFLFVEKGPSVDVILQWARYFDAADQCSLSRIWGGIHTPIDDLPARKIGSLVGNKAYQFANQYFQAFGNIENNIIGFPNPSSGIINVTGVPIDSINDFLIVDPLGQSMKALNYLKFVSGNQVVLDLSNLSKGVYFLVCPTVNPFRILLK